jgi:large subunit ribosomal protein L21
VKSGGRQEKVAVGDIMVMDRQGAKVGETIELPALMLVDGDNIIVDKAKLAATKVTAEVVRDDEKGPKIHILRYKNKTGYRKRQGHRQKLTRVKITGIK